ncbi:ABC transporter permease [Chloroflexota bacterium]
MQKVGVETSARHRRRLPYVAMTIVGILIVLAAFAPLIAPHAPNLQNLPDGLTPPVWAEGGSAEYLLGTDRLGRDILSRIIFGVRIAFQVALVTLLLGGGVGGILGLVAGYYGGKTDTIIMRVADGTLAFPIILLALLFVITLGPGLFTVVLAISLVIWAQFARLVRGETLSIRERDWVKAARINGCTDIRIMAQHIAPHIFSSWLVMVTLQVGFVILIEASLSFLGAGIPPPEPAWGQMVAEGRSLIGVAWWISIMPGLAIMLMVLSFNWLGDWLREVLDPKLRQV